MGIQSSIPTLERNGAVWLAGEASGDFIASLVIPEVAARMGGAPQYGVGGDKMRAAGFRAWYDSRELSVRGYVEVLTHLPRLLSFRKDLITRFGDSMPQVFVGVDAPDFNLAVEEKLRRRGVPTVHFVSPSIWAWRPERIQTIRRAVDHMLLVFPFEQEIYRKAGVPATFVGHPLAGIIPMTPDTAGAPRSFGIGDDRLPVITVMPGSRVDELKGCAPVFFNAVERLLARNGGAHVLIPAVDEQARTRILQVARKPSHDRGRRRGARRLRHGRARVRALQEADGRGLQDARPHGHDHAEEGAHPLRFPAEHPARRKRRARVPAVLLRARSDLLRA